MLKDSEEIIKRRKLSFMHTVTETTTPPITPPSPPQQPLNMMMATAVNMSVAAPPMPVLAVPQTTALALTATTPPSSTLSTHTVAHHHHPHPHQHQQQLTKCSMMATNESPATHAALLTAQGNGTSASLVQDHYSLRWNNHPNHILRAFDALLQTKTLVDVTLVAAETSIRAHKMVLSACSPFFQRVFADTPCKHPVIVLKDFQGWVVQAIVDFMYRGEISVPQERLQTLIQAGESLQVRGLVESSVPEHTPTPAASPDDFGMLDTSLMSSELERCSSFDEESPSMVTAGSKVILPSRLFSSSARRDRERKREREREIERDIESDHEFNQEINAHSDMCTSPMPRRKQARPRRRSGEMPLELPSKPATPAQEVDEGQEEPQEEQPLSLEKDKSPIVENLEPTKTVIKRELIEQMEDDDADGGEHDSGNGNDSRENNESHEKSSNFPNELPCPNLNLSRDEPPNHEHNHSTQDLALEDEDDEDVDDEHNHDHDQEPESEDIAELLNNSKEMRRKSQSALSDGPEDLCTTKKDNDPTGNHSVSENEGSPSNNNNNNNNCKLNNNNRIVLSLKDIRQLNKPSSSSTPNSVNSMNPFSATSLRDLRLDRSANMAEQQCKMDALEAQMHAAAAAAACAAASGENPFQHMEHQMDLSLAAAAAAAAVSHQHQQHSRERDHAMQREQREFQQQQNAYANSLLGQMGMPGLPGPFGPSGPGGPGNGPAPHERLEESMNRLSKEFTPSSPMSLPSHYNPADGPPHPPSPLPFPGMSSALTLTPPHMFGLDSPLGLFPPGIDPGKLYNPLMEMSDPRGMGPDPPPFLKKKMPRPKGQHSAPRGGPPRSWTNAELTEALQHVWNKKMTTSQASRIFGIPYNSLLMYVRGKYGKSLKLEQLRKDCISGPPLELLQMGVSGSSSSNKASGGNSGSSGNGGGNGNGTGGGNGSGSGNGTTESRERESRKESRGSNSADMDLGAPLPGMGPGGGTGPRSASSEPDLLGGPNSLFNPFPQGFYPDFPGGFPGLPLSMLNLLPPSERHQQAAVAAAMHHMSMDEDCKSVGSKQSSSMDEEFTSGCGGAPGMQPLALSREDHLRTSELLMGVGGNGPQPPPPSTGSAILGGGAPQNGAAHD